MVSRHNPDRRARGFTLLEMLVVLAIASLLVSVVMPRLIDLPRRIEINQQRESLLGDIGNLGYLAYMQGKGFTLQANPTPGVDTAPVPLDIPQGWRVQVEKSVIYGFNGTCSGGMLTLTPPEGPAEVYRLSPPACQPQAIEGSG